MVELLEIDDFKKKIKTRYVLHISLIFALILCTISGAIASLLLSKLDYILNLTINIIVTVFISLFLIFYFLNIFPIVSHYYHYFRTLSNVNLEHRLRLVFLNEIENKDVDNVTYRVLQFSYKEGEKEYIDNLYVLDSDIEFVPGDIYKIDTYHNVIIKYEDLSHAND